MHGLNVESPYFFKSLLDLHPLVSFGDAQFSETGFYDRFHSVSDLIQDLMEQQYKHQNYRGTVQFKFYVKILDYQITKIDEQIAAMKLPIGAMSSYTKHREELQTMMNVVQDFAAIREQGDEDFLAF